MRIAIGCGFLCIALLLAGGAASADQKIIQIGGGNRIDNSQGQIEDNVIWLSGILKRSSDDVVNFFAAGKDAVKDVSLYGDTARDPHLEPITRVFDDRDAARLAFKSNQVPELSGSMVKEEVTPALERILDGVGEETDLLLIYNGHGGHNRQDERLNTLKTWRDGRLDVEEMDRILDRAPPQATVRFIFPQCYSGGFYYLIYDDPHSNRLASQNRCGFFAESPFEESEGCSLDTNKEEYRDYSTYFFAPLNGATRNGEPLPLNPDLDGDGAVSFRESHLYALMVGESKDLSRSTSEMYLEAWEPWYLRWSREENRDSTYWKIAEYIAQSRRLGLDGWKLAAAKRRLQQAIDEVVRKQREHQDSIDEITEGIRGEVVLTWPEIEHPYTRGFLNLMQTQSAEVAAAIRELPDYARLVELQDGLSSLNAQELALERDKAQIDKIQRMKRLARLEKQFSRFAGDEEKGAFQRLLGCENGVFFRR